MGGYKLQVKVLGKQIVKEDGLDILDILGYNVASMIPKRCTVCKNRDLLWYEH